MFRAILLLLSFASTPLAILAEGPLRVDGRFLKDANGDKIILRGANAMTMYWDADGSKALPALAATNANVVRLFWQANDNVHLARLDESIQLARDLGMIPMPSIWDATGKWESLQHCVDWWMREDVQAMIHKHHDYLLINIANEAGNFDVNKQEWEEAYRSIIQQFRHKGITAPLVIDAAGWGRSESYLLEHGAALLEADPERNLIFSWHPWDQNQPRSRYRAALQSAVDQGLCFIVGEFSHLEANYYGPIDWVALIEEAEAHEVGWLYWVWRGANTTDAHAITRSYAWDSFNQAGWEVAVGHPLSILHTSVRPAWLGANVTPDQWSFSFWESYWFSPDDKAEGVLSSFHADADRDGHSNGFEWAFGWNPRKTNVQEPLELIIREGRTGILRLPFPQGPEGAVRLESSTNLRSWSSVELPDPIEEQTGQPMIEMEAVEGTFYRWLIDPQAGLSLN